MRKFPQQFSTPVRKVLEAVSLTAKPQIVGSGDDHQVLYSADYDLMEEVPLKSSSLHDFQALVKEAQKVGTITDIKCGEVREWNLLTSADYDHQAELTHLGILWQSGILENEELAMAKKMLKPSMTVPELVKARKELRFGILRWTPQEVQAGHKKFRTKLFYLDDAFKSSGITKVDLVAWVKDKYVEVSNTILWSKDGRPYAKLRPLKDALSEDILLYEEEGNWVKVAKRMLSIAKHKSYLTDVGKLQSILNSPLGAVYTVVSDLELLDEFPDAITPAKKREELDLMRDRMAKLYFPEFNDASNPQKLLPRLREVLQDEMEKELRKEHLLPVRKDYRPTHL